MLPSTRLATCFALVVVILFSSSSLLAQAEPGADRWNVQGVAFNAGVNASTGFEMILTQNADGVVTASGQYDNVNLYGRFLAIGAELPCAPPGRCFQLRGSFEVGGEDGSGFPAGTTTSFTLTVALSAGQINSIYHIGALPTLDFEQYGTMVGFVVP